MPASLEPSLILATDFPETKLPKSLADETLCNVDDGEGWHWTIISTHPSKDGDAGFPASCHHRRESLTLLDSTVLSTHQDPSEVEVLQIEGFLSLP